MTRRISLLLNASSKWEVGDEEACHYLYLKYAPEKMSVTPVICLSSLIPFQAAHGGGKIILKGLYSGLAGNLAGVLP